jgi:hypothetical protein
MLMIHYLVVDCPRRAGSLRPNAIAPKFRRDDVEALG